MKKSLTTTEVIELDHLNENNNNKEEEEEKGVCGDGDSFDVIHKLVKGYDTVEIRRVLKVSPSLLTWKCEVGALHLRMRS